ncbi:RICIN domain-containing protein [Streptomyces sp. NBC_00648]|uniref:RICIN domain-containing protein n=1 Tax=Streptomyces sp. NBC_00648 TaxID=2975797 RepID=UPI00324BF194
MKRLLAAALGLATSLAVVSAVPSHPAEAAIQASFEIRNQYNDNCLDVAGGNTGSGAAVHMWTCNGGANQHWHWVGDQLRSDLNDKCLDLAGTNPYDGAMVELWDCNFQNNQMWGYNNPYLYSKLNSKYLLMVNNGLGSPVVTQGIPFPPDNRNFKWELRPV